VKGQQKEKYNVNTGRKKRKRKDAKMGIKGDG